MSRSSKEKGKRGERLWRDMLRSAGFLKAYRSQQFAGSEHSADVNCPELPSLHFEVKFVEKLNVREAVRQVQRDCGSKTPVVAHKTSREDWLVTMTASDFLSIIQRSDLCQSAE